MSQWSNAMVGCWNLQRTKMAFKVKMGTAFVKKPNTEQYKSLTKENMFNSLIQNKESHVKQNQC